MNENDKIIHFVITDLKRIRIDCDGLKMDNEKTIKIVEAKCDIIRAIQKLEKLQSKRD